MFSLVWIMPPRVMTRSAGRPAAAPRGGGTGGRVGREGRRVRETKRRNVEPTGEPEGQGNDQGVEINEGVDGVPDFSTNIAQQLVMLGMSLRTTTVRGCTYKEFLACNPKEYDGKGGAIVYTRWMRRSSQFRIRVGVGMSGEGFKTFTREEFYPSNDMQKLEIELWNHAMGEAGHAAYTDRFHELARLFPHLVTPKNKRIERYIYGLSLHIRGMVAATKPSTIQKAVQIASILTNESLRNGSIKKNPEKIGNGGEPSKDRNGREDNKRTRTGNAFATTTNPVRRENT
ncbi:hypothetical protein Tco_0928642, partial [Tanacetum coccineum]